MKKSWLLDEGLFQSKALDIYDRSRGEGPEGEEISLAGEVVAEALRISESNDDLRAKLELATMRLSAAESELKKLRKSEEPAIPVCNLCGELCGHTEAWDPMGLINCRVVGGYCSTPGIGFGALDDCTSYVFSLCEFCLDSLFVKFKVKPLVEIHGEPEEFRSAVERVKNDDWRHLKDQFFDEEFLRRKKRNV